MTHDLHVPQDTHVSAQGPDNVINGSAIQHASREYLQAGWRRLALVDRAVRWGFNVFVTDVDVVWFRNPYSYLARFPKVGLVRSCLMCLAALDLGCGLAFAAPTDYLTWFAAAASLRALCVANWILQCVF